MDCSGCHVFPGPLCGELAAGRLVINVPFGWMVLAYSPLNRMRDAYYALLLMLAILSRFFPQQWLLGEQFSDFGAVVSADYAFLSFIMMAGLSVFPSTAWEGAMLSSPVLAVEVIAMTLRLEGMTWSTFYGAFWLLLLVAVVVTLAGMRQLGFMIALVHQAIRDPLTTSFSRLSGEELLEIQFIIAIRSHSPLALAFIDLDHFKKINDRFGHEAGDEVLVNVVKQIREQLRTGDMLARWGGEAFILILPNMYCSDAMIAIERLREAGFGKAPDGAPVTASIGLSEWIEDRAPDWKTLVDMADWRRYLVKRRGKNCAVGW